MCAMRFGINVLFVLGLLTAQTDTAKILSLFPAQSPSHYILVQPLLQELAKHGHEITSISPYPQQKPLTNFRDIVVLKDYTEILELLKNSQGMHDMSIWQLFNLMLTMSTGMAKSIMEQPEIKELLANPDETFDLLIVDVCADEALFGFAAHFQASTIGVAPYGAHLWYTELTGSPIIPALMPHHLLNLTEKMSFLERLYNFYAYASEYYFYSFKYLPALEQIYQQYFSHTRKTFADTRRNFSLVLLNQHSSLGISRPILPNMIEVGGMQVSSKISPLPSEMQQFLNNATDGAIYFSLGSNIRSETLSSQRLNAILNTFRALPQRILWKFEATNLTNKPDNVFVSSWFPQSDVLAHPNIKLFITHGGFLSLTESIAHGIPVLGIPFYADQFMNMARAQRLGFALTLDFNELCEPELLLAIQELLSKPSYTRMAKTLSERFHDKPQTALETAVFWVEYVLRHHGALYLRSEGVFLNTLQYYGLDVIGLLLLIFGFLVSGIVFGFLYLWRYNTIIRKLKSQ